MSYKSTIVLALVFIFAACSEKSSGSMDANFANIKKQIKKGEHIHYFNVEFTDDIDFTDLVSAYKESGNYSRSIITSSITFENCTFKGKIIGYKKTDKQTDVVRFQQNISFTGCHFHEDVDFREADVMGLTDFSGSVFHKAAIFEGFASYYKDARFNETVFKGEARFQRSVFNGSLNFLRAIFENNAFFQNAVFVATAQFGACVFAKYTDFVNLQCNGHIFFNYAEFKDRFFMNNALISGRAEFMDVKFGKLSEIKGCVFSAKTRFNNAVLNGSIDFSETAFYYSKPHTEGFKQLSDSSIILENTYFQSGELILITDFVTQ